MSLEERDPVSGYLTTGHDWNGIKELNSPVPRIVFAFILVTHLYALVVWVLLPTWPLGQTFTRGLLGIDQKTAVAADLATANAARAGWTDALAVAEFDVIRADPVLMARALATAEPIYGQNCQACHGAGGIGGPGFPRLNDDDWLWGNAAETIHETLRVGINVAHPETRYAQMPAFGRDELLTRPQIELLVPHVISLSTPGAATTPEATVLFAENCASCHGDTGAGMIDVGAPNLTDDIWQYGGDADAIRATLRYGRQGQMPAWDTRLTEAERKILTLYVLTLGDAQ